MSDKAVRIAKVELEIPEERRRAWYELARECQRVKNHLWRMWISDHYINESEKEIRDDLDTGKKEFPVNCILGDDQFTSTHLQDAFQGVNARTLSLLIQDWKRNLLNRKAANSSLPRWVAIVLGNEAIPSFTKPQPIPFNKYQSCVVKDDKEYCLQVRIDRLPRDKKLATSTQDSCLMLLRRKGCFSTKAILDRIISGEYEFKGSNLEYKNKKWFASIAYQAPKNEKHYLDPNKVLYVRPGLRTPWRVRIGTGRSFQMGGNGMHVSHAREAIMRERKSRQEHYRYAGSNQKGHGRQRAYAVCAKLSSRWRDFTKRYNHEVTKRIVNLAVASGCGKVVYLKPLEGKERFFLSRTDGDTRSSWDFFQFGTFLTYKCKGVGIDCEVKETKGGKVRAKTAAVRVRGVRKASKPNSGKRSKGK